MLDAKISLVPTHQLIIPSTLLAPVTEIWTHKATKMHTLKPLTYELFWKNTSIKMVTGNYKDNYNLISPLLDQNNDLQEGAL